MSVSNDTFQMSRVEADASEAFITDHECAVEYNGLKVSYAFTPTGIGTGIEVSCACGASKDVTDYGSW